jgi:hypothetical protein
MFIMAVGKAVRHVISHRREHVHLRHVRVIAQPENLFALLLALRDLNDDLSRCSAAAHNPCSWLARTMPGSLALIGLSGAAAHVR